MNKKLPYDYFGYLNDISYSMRVIHINDRSDINVVDDIPVVYFPDTGRFVEKLGLPGSSKLLVCIQLPEWVRKTLQQIGSDEYTYCKYLSSEYRYFLECELPEVKNQRYIAAISFTQVKRSVE